MNFIVHGASGRMGCILTEAIRDGGKHGIAALVSPEWADAPDEKRYSSLSGVSAAADCVIDFSNHAATRELLLWCEEKKMPLVLATTGHTADEREAIADAAGRIPVFFSANMSVGVAVLANFAKTAAALFPDADIEIVEKHHHNKLDVPSGTALLLADRIKEARSDAQYVIGRHLDGKRTKTEIGIHAVRIGSEVGTHEILISTGNETITLKHEAENRKLFADGAIAAAEFLAGKAPGLYTMQDIVS